MAGILGAALLPLQGLSGFAFGTGYGAGVRFGYEDVYPYLKSNMSEIAKMLNIPFASSGFKLASGVTAKQGMGLHDPSGGMGTPQENQGYSSQLENQAKTVKFGHAGISISGIDRVQSIVLYPDGRLQVQRYGQDVWPKQGTALYNTASKYFK